MIVNQITFNFSNIDEYALLITIVGCVVVFIALSALVLVISRIAILQNFFIRLKIQKTNQESGPVGKTPVISLSADENAAICTALYLYFTEMHDEEKYVMTVKKVSRNYSPWSSKIYGVMNFSKRG
ncbi:MAG: OadG family protein [Bacteroidales bacterium]|nr:OadG family protein [Bacteroidales bacterium]HNW72711.1 OadG family protein [Bacteroidales bacterium]HPS49247.1 OadG family protein [Bacteroidales bacterium]